MTRLARCGEGAVMITAGSTVAIRRYPTKLAVRCQCGHQGVVETFIDKPPKLRCSRCGSRDAIVVQRDRTRAWSAQRRGR